ncbi:MAG: hypothetical protein CMF56_01270 [Leifsonia sp.]|nr:hypothetical protein [Leifsonia sp.]|tara:strand:- start:26279 stop:28228 length:1950 start_codon:yes stop_codon:yes gene_type:complete
MTKITIEAGTLLAGQEGSRVRSGLLLPYGEKCSSNLGSFEVEAGAFAIPDKRPTGLFTINDDHDLSKTTGRATSVAETPSGLFASFEFDDSPAGNAALADIDSGKRTKLSVEVAGVAIKGGKAVAGTLFGAALVEKGAFPSATLLAAAPDTVLAEEVANTSSEYATEYTDGDGVTWLRKEKYESKTDANQADDGSTVTTSTSVSTVTEEPIAAEEQQENEEDADMALPNTLTAGKASAAPTPAPATATPRPIEYRTVLAALSRSKLGMATAEDMTLLASTRPGPMQGSAAEIGGMLLGALSDIKISGSGSLPDGGGIQPNWVGHINSGVTYERQFVPLAKTGTDISVEGKKGFEVKRGEPGSPVDSYASTGKWAGNKAAIGSGVGHSLSVESVLHRFAFGNDIAREFNDLPGGAPFLEAYLGLIRQDHLVWSDELARLAWIELGGAPVAASAAIPEDFPESLGLVIQAIRAVKSRKADNLRDKPSFVIVNDDAAEEIDYTPFEKIPHWLKMSWNMDGTGLADGDVVLVNGDMGIDGSPAALAGADYALELDELAGGPLWIDALNIAQGGIDKALHGYLQEFQVRPEAVVMVGTPQTRANSTEYPEGRLIVASSVVYRVVVAGTSHTSAPTAPAVGATVTDGDATLLRLA